MLFWIGAILAGIGLLAIVSLLAYFYLIGHAYSFICSRCLERWTSDQKRLVNGMPLCPKCSSCAS